MVYAMRTSIAANLIMMQEIVTVIPASLTECPAQTQWVMYGAVVAAAV